jgi:hypothetical protein
MTKRRRVGVLQGLARDALGNLRFEVLNLPGSEKRYLAINDC